MLKKKVIAVDFDDIVFDFHGNFHAWHNREYGTTLTYEEIFSFTLQDVFGTDADTMLERVRRFTREEHSYAGLMPGALEGLKRLQRIADLHIVTSRSESNHGVVDEWMISRNCRDIFTKLHFTNGYGGLAEHRKRTKSEVCMEIGAVLHIEDAISHAAEVVSGACIPVIMPNRPWNRAWQHPEGVHRVDSWDEMVSVIETHL